MTLHSQMPSGHVRPCAQAILCCQASFLHPGVHASYAAGGLGGGFSMALPSGDHFQGTKTMDTEAPPAGLQGLLPTRSRRACVGGDAEPAEQSLLLGERMPAPPGNRRPNKRGLAGCPSACTARPWKPASHRGAPLCGPGRVSGRSGRVAGRGRGRGALRLSQDSRGREPRRGGGGGFRARAAATSASCQKVRF